MCKCTPNIRTPFCGKPGCEWPAQSLSDIIQRAQNLRKEIRQIFLDAHHWNIGHPEEKPIDVDPNGELHKLEVHLDRLVWSILERRVIVLEEKMQLLEPVGHSSEGTERPALTQHTESEG